MAIRNFIVFRDWEAAGQNRFKTQPTQLAAVMIDVPRLTVVEDSLFESMIQPIWDDEEAEKQGLQPVDWEAIKISGFTKEQLEAAPSVKFVWENYLDYLSNYNLKGKTGGKWDAPGVAGFNNIGFDDFIDRRLCETYGPKLDEWGAWTHYHPFHNYDVQQMVSSIFNNTRISPTNSISMDAIREYMGYKKDGAHNARVDVLQGADLLVRFLKLYRNLVNGNLDLPKGKKIKFKGCVGGAL